MRTVVRLVLPACIALAVALPEVRGQDGVSALINIDIPSQHVERFKRELGVSEDALLSFFQTLSEAEVPLRQQKATLVEISERHRQLLDELAAAPGGYPRAAELKAEAAAALDAGNPERADELLAALQAVQVAAMDQRQLEAATAAQRGQIALTRLRYREAAEHFAVAACRVPPGHDEQARRYLDQEAGALYWHGDKYSDKLVLDRASDRYRALLRLQMPPLQRAATRTNLGNVLRRLGELESGSALLEEAVDTHLRALEGNIRERAPRLWAVIQGNLGRALHMLGERESDSTRLEGAVAAYRAALEEYARERVTIGGAPPALAWWMWEIANRWVLDQRKSDTKRQEEALARFPNIEPGDEKAYDGAQFLYHEKLFAFAEAFDLNQAWLERHPEDFEAQANLAEAAFTVGRFSEAEGQLAELVNRPRLERGDEVALRALQICSLLALGSQDALPAKLRELDNLLNGTLNAENGTLNADWTFSGTQHFIRQHPELSQHQWLTPLLEAIEEGNPADAREAVERALRQPQRRPHTINPAEVPSG